MMDEAIIKEWVMIFGGGSLPLILVIIYLFNRPDKFEKWMRIFYQVVYWLSTNLPKIKRKIDKKLVAVSIQDTVNEVCDKLNDQSPGILPNALKIEWVTTDTPDSFISKGKAVVRLKNYNNEDRNIVESTLLYLKAGFLPRAKNYLDKTLRHSSEFIVASRVFVARQDTGAYDYFCEKELSPAIDADAQIKNDLQLLENLDSVGFFTRVFLAEVALTGQKLLGTVPSETIRRELREFADFLDTIATKAKEENVKLAFKGTKVKVSVILVAKKETILRLGINPYIGRIQKSIKEGYESIYLAGWGDQFVSAIISLKSRIENELLTVLRRYDYPVHGSNNKAILLVCQPKSSYWAQRKQVTYEVQEALSEIVPEIKTGRIEIVAIARIENIGFKVAVKAADPALGDPRAYCIGKDAKIVTQLKRRFPNEFIGICEWSEQISDFVRSALHPLNPRHIDTINFDEENLIADISIKNRESFNKAKGKFGNNVKLASELTGYYINLQLNLNVKEEMPPEIEIKELLEQAIPEIQNNDIEIVKIARIRGICSKVIVKWAQANSSKDHRASEICDGYRRISFRTITKPFPNEYVYFHELCDTPEQQISVCLFPIKNHDIVSIEIDDRSLLAVVTLKNASSRTQITDEELALCEDITGFNIMMIDQ